MVGPDGLLKKDDFIRILQSSNFFMKTFDKNQDGIVTEVGTIISPHYNILDNYQTEMTTRAELAFRALDKDNSGYITGKEMKNLSSKLSPSELSALMKKVINLLNLQYTYLRIEKNVHSSLILMVMES